ncbi:MAG: DUF4190 domain-containing protein [Thermomicrobiales bacterium]
MARRQPTPPSDYDALFARDTGSYPALGRQILASRRLCPMAVISLVSGILTWIAIPVIGAVVAIMLGHGARRLIRRSGGELLGDGMAVAGIVLGYAQLFIIVLLIGAAHLPPSIG